MKKSIILVALAISPLLLTDLAEAKPNKDNTQISNVKHKKKKVRAQKVEPQNNAFLKECGFFDFSCHSTKSENQQYALYTKSEDETSANYWQKEYARKNPVPTPQPVKTPTNKIVASKDCIFCEDKTTTYTEAKKWEGKNSLDKDDRKELTKLFNESKIPAIDPGKLPWCAAFANAMLNRLGHEGTKSLMARSFLHYGAPTKQPQVGDIVITKRGKNPAAGHVGFFEGFEEVDGVKYVKVFGGNTDKTVTTGWFPVTGVLGFRKLG
jgi:uncharacterized protein (TIGR02594 family)